MKKVVGLITENKKIVAEYTQQLLSVFGDVLEVHPYCIEDGSAFGEKKEQVFVVSAMSSRHFEEVRQTIPKDRRLIPVRLSFFRRNLLLLNSYPQGTHALLVNVSKRMAEETITSIYQTGYNHIEYVPYYPGCCYSGDIKLAVTPGEAGLVPDFVEEVLDIESRHIDTQTMVELAVETDCEYILDTRRFLECADNLFDLSGGFSLIMAKYKNLQQEFDGLLHLLDVGILGAGADHRVFACNQQAARLLGVNRGDLIFKSLAGTPAGGLFQRCKLKQYPFKEQMEAEGGRLLDASLTPIMGGAQYVGAFAVLSEAGQKQKTEPTADKLARKGHVARYRFSDIAGNSSALRRTVELAEMMAKTDSSVLITGESGSGKELFAHSIHNSSPRAGGPFVAINCAAIPDHLLESELFGYEEGSFTGARKGGKIGLFELAANGSIFLDEIEGMSQNLQVKLLRVIQEREIMRVGGDAIIPTDVRIISASNQEILPLIQEGRFRSDLFYRIGTLPIEVPPLRKRREDILLLLEEFKNILNLRFVLTEECRTLLLKYPWPGNIRELRNCVEYLGCLNLPVIEPEHLPPAIQRDFGAAPAPAATIDEAILTVLKGSPCGRAALATRLKNQGIALSEAQLRSHMARLRDKGWISSRGGRGGSHLTEEGMERLQKLDNK